MPFFSSPSARVLYKSIPSGYRVLVVSDLHLDDTDFDGYFSLESCLRAVDAAVVLGNRERPDELWVLGDFFHMSVRDPEFAREQLERLAATEVEQVVVVAGNHDAQILDDVARLYRPTRPHISLASFWRFEYDGKCERQLPGSGERDKTVWGEKIWLTHDGDYSVWLREDQCVSYLREIRKDWKIPSQDLLLTGHTHRLTITDAGKTRSLGVWNVPGHGGKSTNHCYTYADIGAGNNGVGMKFVEFLP